MDQRNHFSGELSCHGGDQIGRQWSIIQTLISSRMGKTAAELAEDLECNPRTIYRDLEALQVAGFPIYTDRVEGKNLWSLLDTVKHEIPIPFNLTERPHLFTVSNPNQYICRIKATYYI